MRVIPSTTFVRVIVGAAFVLVGWFLGSAPAQADDKGVLGSVRNVSTSAVTSTVETAAAGVDRVVQDATSVVVTRTAATPVAAVATRTTETITKTTTGATRTVETVTDSTVKPVVAEVEEKVLAPVAAEVEKVLEPVVAEVDKAVLEPVVDAVPPGELATPPPASLPPLGPGVPDRPASPDAAASVDGAAGGAVDAVGAGIDVVVTRVAQARNQRSLAAEPLLTDGLTRGPQETATELPRRSTAGDRTSAQPVHVPAVPGPPSPVPGQPNAGLLSGPGSAGSSGSGSKDLATTPSGLSLPQFASAAASFDHMTLPSGPASDLGSRPD